MFTSLMELISDPEEQRKFERIYIEYQLPMYHCAYRILKNSYDAEDAVQQAFLRIMNHMKDIDESEPGKTKSYLTIVARNMALDVYRKKKREMAHTVSYDEHEMFIEDPEGQDFEDIEIEEDHGLEEALARALKKLPMKYADVVRLTYVHGLSSERVGEILNISADNVRQRLVRARKKLGELIEKEVEENKEEK